MKITIKKNNEVVYHQVVDGAQSVVNKIMAEIMALPQGTTDEVIFENNQLVIPVKTKDVDVATFVKITNGIIVKKASAKEETATTTEPVAPQI